ncbi:MAG: M48 family metalloprotease [Candidatus Omnitrophota bacterium]
MLEEDYLKNTFSSGGLNLRYSVDNFKDSRLKTLNEYSTQLIKELIIPKLTLSVNTSKKYSQLRQVYYSLILAQWFKSRFKDKPYKYSELIDKQDLTNFTSKTSWSKDTYFKEYQKSFKDGEYNFQEPVYTLQGKSIRSYFSGGEMLGPEILAATKGLGGVRAVPNNPDLAAVSVQPIASGDVDIQVNSGQEVQIVTSEHQPETTTVQVATQASNKDEDLGAQVANARYLQRLKRFLNVLRKNAEFNTKLKEFLQGKGYIKFNISPDADISDADILEFCLEFLREKGLVTTWIDGQGNEVNIIEDSQGILKSADKATQRLIQAIRTFAIDPQAGVKAINFCGTKGIWKIIGFKNELGSKWSRLRSVAQRRDLQHEQDEIRLRKLGLNWIRAHVLVENGLNNDRNQIALQLEAQLRDSERVIGEIERSALELISKKVSRIRQYLSKFALVLKQQKRAQSILDNLRMFINNKDQREILNKLRVQVSFADVSSAYINREYQIHLMARLADRLDDRELEAVLCHEIAHALNGDLADENRRVPVSEVPVSLFGGLTRATETAAHFSNLSQKKEREADALAISLLLKLRPNLDEAEAWAIFKSGLEKVRVFVEENPPELITEKKKNWGKTVPVISHPNDGDRIPDLQDKKRDASISHAEEKTGKMIEARLLWLNQKESSSTNKVYNYEMSSGEFRTFFSRKERVIFWLQDLLLSLKDVLAAMAGMRIPDMPHQNPEEIGASLGLSLGGSKFRVPTPKDYYENLDKELVRFIDKISVRPNGIVKYVNASLGLEFEYYVTHKGDYEKGGEVESRLSGGHGFAHYSRRMQKAVIIIDGDFFPEEFVEFIAIHEYGETLYFESQYHHIRASQLEFAAAKKLGKLEAYLDWIKHNYLVKVSNLNRLLVPEPGYIPEEAQSSQVYRDWRVQVKNSLEAEAARGLVKKYGWVAAVCGRVLLEGSVEYTDPLKQLRELFVSLRYRMREIGEVFISHPEVRLTQEQLELLIYAWRVSFESSDRDRLLDIIILAGTNNSDSLQFFIQAIKEGDIFLGKIKEDYMVLELRAHGVNISALEAAIVFSHTPSTPTDSLATENQIISSPLVSHNDESEAEKMGGIDFRFLPIVTQAIGNLSNGFILTEDVKLGLSSVNLDEEWSQIEKMAEAGITPSSERIKEYIQASCIKGNTRDKDIDKIVLCISKILRCDEDRCSKSDPVLMDILIVLESQRNPQELNKAFLGIIS